MPTTTYSFAKSVSLVDYQKPFISGSQIYSWNWKPLVSQMKTSRQTEQYYSLAGLPVASRTGELEQVYYRDMAELPATTITMYKSTIATSFSYEFLKYNIHASDIMQKRAKAMGESLAYYKDVAVANVFNNCESTASGYVMYDSVALCGTHTTNNGDTVDNSLTAASLSFDNLWLMVDYFNYSLTNHAGLKFTAKPKYVLTHPVNAKTLEKILKTDREPDQADWNTNTLGTYSLMPIYCNHITSTDDYWLISDKFKDDFPLFNVESARYKEEEDFDRMGIKYRGHQMFGLRPVDYFNIVFNPGS